MRKLPNPLGYYVSSANGGEKGRCNVFARLAVRIPSLVLVVLLAPTAAAQGQADPIASVTEAELRDHIFFLASDLLEGRNSGGKGYMLAAEYGAEFRRDVESFLSSEAVAAVTIPGRIELPRVDGVRYHAFTDPSGASVDSFTLAVSHRDNDVGDLDCVRELKPPFKPDQVVKGFACTLKAYGVTRVTGDRYSGQWVRDAFQECGIAYVVSNRTKSDIYAEVLAPINSGMVELLDVSRLRAQLQGLERRTARGGKDSIDHAPGAHDDVANCVAGALLLALEKRATDYTGELTAASVSKMRVGSQESILYLHDYT
jgi:hypothetical protein